MSGLRLDARVPGGDVDGLGLAMGAVMAVSAVAASGAAAAPGAARPQALPRLRRCHGPGATVAMTGRVRSIMAMVAALVRAWELPATVPVGRLPPSLRRPRMMFSTGAELAP